MKQKILMLLFVLMCALHISAQTLSTLVAEQPSKGSGTISDPYQIETAANLKWFAQQVNKGNDNRFINAILMNDIDFKDGNGIYDQTMIGKDVIDSFRGVFDGNYHQIKVDYYVSSENYRALFHYTNNATIKRLRVTGEILTFGKYAGGIVGYCDYSTITCCESSVTLSFSRQDIDLDASYGGIVGYINTASNLSNLAYTGSLLLGRAINCAGLVGWSNPKLTIKNSFVAPQLYSQNSSEGSSTLARADDDRKLTFENCYSSVTIGKEQGTKVTDDQVSSGELCWKVNLEKCSGNEPFRQNLSKKGAQSIDRAPTILHDHKIVYYGDYNCPASTTAYTNVTHSCSNPEDVDKVCDECGKPFYDAPEYDSDKDQYIINTLNNYLWVANEVNNGNTSINAKLNTDINLGEKIVMVGNIYNEYKGTFDGNFHTLTINWDLQSTTNSYFAPFRYVKGGTIKNLIVDGSITTASLYVAGIVSSLNGGYVRNCKSNITITQKSSLNPRCAGFVSRVDEHTESIVDNCIFTGTFNFNDSGMWAGIVGNGGGCVKISNCVFAPQSVTYNDNYSFSSSATMCINVNESDITNCYYTYELGDKQGTLATMDEMKSGKICYLLNDSKSDGKQAWYQNLSGENKDDLPTIVKEGHATVLSGLEACPYTGSEIYSDHTHTASESFNEYGIKMCANEGCSAEVEYESITQDADGTYLIKHKDNLMQFAELVNSGSTSINGRLMNNISTGHNNIMIGTDDNRYAGTFDGNCKTITVDFETTEDKIALFRYVAKATIHDLKVDGTIRTSARNAGGVVCFAHEVTMKNIISSVDIISTFEGDATHAGIIAELYKSNSTLENCAFNGRLLGEKTTNCAGLVGFMNLSNLTIKSSYVNTVGSTVSSKGSNTIVRENSSNTKVPTIQNVYFTNSIGNDKGGVLGVQVSSEDLASGRLCYLLNDKQTDGTQSWYQNLSGENKDLEPVPYDSENHLKVYMDGDACPITASIPADTHVFRNATHKFDSDLHVFCQNEGCKYCSADITLSDDMTDPAETVASCNDKIVKSATYSRNLTDKWSTIVLPFDIKDTSEDGEDSNYHLYVINSISGSSIHLQKVTTLTAGTPAIINRQGDEDVEITFDVQFPLISSTLTSYEDAADMTLVGTYSDINITERNGYVLDNEKLWDISLVKGSSEVHCTPFHAYMHSSTTTESKPDSFSFDDNDDTTFIINHEALEEMLNKDTKYYDANGIQRKSLKRGLNIVRTANGKAVKIVGR